MILATQLLIGATSCKQPHEHDYEKATCISPRTCECGETKGEALGHIYSASTCTQPGLCERCGEVDALAPHNYEEANCTLPKTCKDCGTTEGEALGHDFTELVCSAYQTCKRCGESGERAEHDFADATCTTPLTCKKCGAKSGQPLGHAYNGTPTCTEPQYCTRCGSAGNNILGHDYSSATCTTSSVCERCGLVGSAPLGHNYANATCTQPKICRRCNATNGTALGHNYKEATCTEPQKCTRCSAEKGSPLGHSYSNDKCIRCGEVDPDTLPTPLEDVFVIDRRGYNYNNDCFIDSYGNEYTSYHLYNDNNSRSIHNLDGKYTVFSGSFVASNSMFARTKSTIEIYVDGKLAWSVENYDRTTGKVDFTISVDNATKLSIYVDGNNILIEQDPKICLINGELWK